MIFLDTNIILRFILQDHLLYSSKAKKIFRKIDLGEVIVYTTWLVIFEVVFVLQNSQQLSKPEIAAKLLPILLLENLKMDHKNLINSTFKNYVTENISLADAYHVALMEQKQIKKTYSFDKDFDKFKNILRKEIL
jgi:predicted nucleic acid-binding protein